MALFSLCSGAGYGYNGPRRKTMREKISVQQNIKRREQAEKGGSVTLQSLLAELGLQLIRKLLAWRSVTPKVGAKVLSGSKKSLHFNVTYIKF